MRAHPEFEDLSAYADGEPSSVPYSEITRHVAGCGDCRRLVERLGAVDVAVADVPRVGCDAAQPLISAQLDGEASGAEAAIASAHLAGCQECRRSRATWDALKLALNRLPSGAPSPAADARIRGTVRGRRSPVPLLRVPVLAPAVATALAVAIVVLAGLPAGTPPLPQPAGRLVASVSAQVVLNSRTNVLYSLDTTRAVLVARDVATSDVVAEIPVGGSPSALALNDQTNAVYVLDAGSKTLTEVNGATNTVVSRVAVPVDGTPTAVEVNQRSGKVVVASTSVSGVGSTAGQLAVLDPTSRLIESVRSVDVAPLAVAVNGATNRAYLLGAGGVSVVDANTYAPIERLPAAVAIAPNAGRGPDAILREGSAGAIVSFVGSDARAQLVGRPVTVVALPDGTFAALTEVDGNGRITVVRADGETLGSLAVAASARQLTFDADTQRFIGAEGQPVASIARGAIVVATASPVPSASAHPSASPSASPVASATPAPLPAAVLPLVLPSPSAAPIPGATVAAAGVYRFALGDQGVVAAVSSGDRIWFLDQRGDLRAVDAASGGVTTLASLGRSPRGAILLASARTVYVVDVGEGSVLSVDVASGRQSPFELPVSGSVAGAALGPEDHVWLLEQGSGNLVDFDARARRVSLVPLGGGIVAGALAVDLSGRVWLADALRGVFYSYEPGIRRLNEFASPSGSRVTRIAAEPSGQVWFATAAGEMFVVNAGRISPLRAVPGGVVALTASGSGTFFVSAANPPQAGRAAGGAVLAVPSGANVIAVDASGRAWVGGASFPAFFVVEPR